MLAWLRRYQCCIWLISERWHASFLREFNLIWLRIKVRCICRLSWWMNGTVNQMHLLGYFLVQHFDVFTDEIRYLECLENRGIIFVVNLVSFFEWRCKTTSSAFQ